MNGRMRLDVAASSFVADLNRARSEALKRNRSVFVAKTGTNSYHIEFVGARTLQEGATFGTASPDTVRFAAFGPVTGGGATYPVSAGNKTLNVTLSVTGYARVQ
jgi:Flp pilus assembly protein TadG